MTKDVVISIKGIQKYVDMEDDSMELVTDGVLSTTPNGYQLTYEETELSGMQGTTTVFDLQPERVILMRTGQVCTQMVFEEGRRHLALYDTPYGALQIGVAARKVKNRINEHGGRLDIAYAMEVDNALAGQNYFHIQVKEKKNLQ